MENSARIRINLSTKEFEVEGSEQFVKEYAEKIENLLSTFANPKSPTLPLKTDNGVSSTPTGNTELPTSFGEYLHQFPKSITNVDRMLIAGFYAQSNSEDNAFVTSSADDLLQEQGVKVTNPPDSIAKNKNAKRVFAVEKGKFRVSHTGVAHINKLLEKSEE